MDTFNTLTPPFTIVIGDQQTYWNSQIKTIDTNSSLELQNMLVEIVSHYGNSFDFNSDITLNSSLDQSFILTMMDALLFEIQEYENQDHATPLHFVDDKNIHITNMMQIVNAITHYDHTNEEKSHKHEPIYNLTTSEFILVDLVQ